MALSLQEHAATNVNEKTPRTRIDYNTYINITIWQDLAGSYLPSNSNIFCTPTAPDNPREPGGQSKGCLVGDLIGGGLLATLTLSLRHHGAQLVQQHVQGVIGFLLSLRKVSRSRSLESSAGGVAQDKDQPSVQSPSAEFQAAKDGAFSMSTSWVSFLGQILNVDWWWLMLIDVSESISKTLGKS